MTGRPVAAWEPASDRSETRPLPAGRIHIVDEAVPYADGWAHQRELHHSRLMESTPDTVLILEHRPVFTLGRRTEPAHWGAREESLRDLGADLHWVNRGGSVTYHGPGQIVVYPIVRLADHASGPKQFVRLLEEVVLRLLGQWGIEGTRVDKKPGIWLDGAPPTKIASVGIRIERGVTLHGFSLNVDMDLSPFRLIQPCGFADCRMTSMAALLGSSPDLHRIKHELARRFTDVFSVSWPTAFVTSLARSTLSP